MSEKQDIFGEVSSEPDISTDALNWEPAGVEPVGAEGQSLPTDEDDDDTEVVDETADGVGVDDDVVDGDNEDTSPADDDVDIPENLRGKTPAELAKIIADSQAFISRQGTEIGELRKMVEQIQSTAEQQYAQEMAPSVEFIDTVEDGVGAYHEAMNLLDQGFIGPEAIDEIIDAVRDLDPSIAARMDRDFGMRLARAEMTTQMAPVIEQSYHASLQAATAQVNADPDATAYREDIVRIVQNPANLVEHQIAAAYQHARTASDIADALKAALTVARGANPVKSASYKQQLAASKQNEQVEGGNASAAEKPRTEEELIRESLLSTRSGADSLFSDFGR